MAVTTKRLQVKVADELLADGSNGGKIFLAKNVFIFCHRYVVATDYTATDQLTIEFDGAQEVLYHNCKEILTASNTNLNTTAPADISGRTGKYVTTDATNAASLAVEVFAIVRV
ncbi:MAG: hypothetical protein ACYC2U_04710 [Candidatus Amoebophilus sp.]